MLKASLFMEQNYKPDPCDVVEDAPYVLLLEHFAGFLLSSLLEPSSDVSDKYLITISIRRESCKF